MTKIIGLTGGIGSGKTTVAKMFIKLGVAVYFADEAAREIMMAPEVLSELNRLFGPDIFSNNTLDRKKLAAVVFNNKQELDKLNHLIHPKVAQHFSDWLKGQLSRKFIIREAAILFESGSYKDCDKIITVTAPLETRIERVIFRDNIDREHVLQRMQNQWTEQQKINLSDFVIENINLPDTYEKVLKIFKILKEI